MKTLTNKQIEIEKKKIELQYFITERKNQSYNGYISGVNLKEGRGMYNEKRITNMILSGDDIIIFTDNYRFKKPVTQILKFIEIEY